MVSCSVNWRSTVVYETLDGAKQAKRKRTTITRKTNNRQKILTKQQSKKSLQTQKKKDDDHEENEQQTENTDKAAEQKKSTNASETNEREGPLIQEMQHEHEWEAMMDQSRNSNLVFIAYFTSSWCKPCKKFYPVFEELCNKAQSNMKFIKVDIDEFDEIALENKVTSLPTFIRFENGTQCGVSGPNKEKLEQLFIAN